MNLPVKRLFETSKRRIFTTVSLLTIILPLLVVIYVNQKTKTEKYIAATQSSTELISKPADWPTYINWQKRYTLKYPRELTIREIHTETEYLFNTDVVFESAEGVHSQVGIDTLVLKDTNVKPPTDWIREHSDRKRPDDSYFESVENLRQIQAGNYSAVEFYEKRNDCFEDACMESVIRWFIVKKDAALIILSCRECPKDVQLIWKDMVTSFEIMSNDRQTITLSETGLYSHAGIQVYYPRGWFFKPLSARHFMLSSFNTEGFYTGSYTGGLTIYVARCGLSLEECLLRSGFSGKDLLDQDLVDALGGIVEKIDTPTMEGFVYGQMDPIKYEQRSNPHNIIVISKKTRMPVWLHIELSLYDGSFDLTNREVLYYYPALKTVIESLKIL